eukprot:1969939-Rhodomonas_salina.1
MDALKSILAGPAGQPITITGTAPRNPTQETANPIQETAVSVQFVPGMRFLVFDPASPNPHGCCTPKSNTRNRNYIPKSNTRNRIFSTNCTRNAVSCI